MECIGGGFADADDGDRRGSDSDKTVKSMSMTIMVAAESANGAKDKPDPGTLLNPTRKALS